MSIKVKPLEWRQFTDDAWVAPTEIGRYRIYWYGGNDWCSFLESGNGAFNAASASLEAAKAAAQADYEARILSALDLGEPTP